jgi:hypothetical protein
LLIPWHHDRKRNHHFLMYDKKVAIAALLVVVGRLRTGLSSSNDNVL